MNKTAVQILDTSRLLFNEQGVESVSIAQIAKTLGISTGNLTYHFAKKQQIIGEHIRRLETDMVAILETFARGGGPGDFMDSYTNLFRATWDYRYLFTGTAYLLQNDLISKLEYQTLVDHIYEIILERTDKMIESGTMKPIPPPHDNRTLVDCVWWQWLGWLDANQLLPEHDQLHPEELLENGIRHQLFLIRPYLSKRFSNQLYKEFARFETA